MYEIRPPKRNKKAQSLIILFFAGSIALLLLSAVLKGLPFLWVIQLFAILLLVAAVFLITRYLTKGYIYRIADGDLTVTEISSGGKRQLTVCRVALASIEECFEYSGGEGIKKYKGQHKRIFDYRPDLAPDKSILLLTNEGGEEAVILLGCDEGLLQVIRDRSDWN